MKHQQAISTRTVECCHCLTLHPADRNEDGCPEIEQVACGDDECEVRLCSECPQFQCDYCNLPHCMSHLHEYSGLRLCGPCMADVAEECEVVQ